MTKTKHPKPAGNAKGSQHSGPKKSAPREHAVGGRKPSVFELAELQAEAARKSAAALYLRALADPRGMQPCRAPDPFMHPTAVWKTVKVVRVKVVPLPTSGTGAPDHGVFGYCAPGLANKLVVGTQFGGGLPAGTWNQQQVYTDPTFGVGITNNTMLGYRCTAMSISFDTTASALVAAGSLRVLCIAGAPGSPDAFTTVVGQPWGVLDDSRACVLDPRRADLGDRQFCWSWANTNDMTYIAPQVTHYGPVIAFELGTEEANMEFIVTVTSHYQGLPSLQQQMIMETDTACVATWDDVTRVREAASIAGASGSSVPAAVAVEQEERKEESEPWHVKLTRGLKHFQHGVAPGVMGVLGDIASEMLPDFLGGDDDDDDPELEVVRAPPKPSLTETTGPFRGIRRK